MDIHEWPCRIKSVRHKRRLVKTDRDKQLIQLYKRRKELWEQQKALPMVPLEQPYQRGWKRFFVLRDDIKRSPMAGFYEAMLTKINTVEYHHDKAFKRKKRRKKRYGYKVSQQLLKELYDYEWLYNDAKLTENEKACFARVESFDIKTSRASIRYVFAEPWRYVLKVVPHIVTHVKLMDVDMERELSYIDDYIDHNNLHGRVNKLTRGRRLRWKDEFNERAKYTNRFKNIPRYSPKEAYLELET